MNKFWNWVSDAETAEGTPTERTLLLEGVIAEESWWDDEVTPDMFRNELNSGTGNVKIIINSPGGDCVAASQIYTMLKEYDGDVNVEITGMAASAASVIAMAGKHIAMSPTSLMMIHNPFTTASGNSDDMRKAIQMLDEVKEGIINAYEAKTGLSRAKISHLMDSETWMNANLAKELGFCDEVLFGENEEEKTNSYSYSSASAMSCLLNKVMAKIPHEEVPAEDKTRVNASDLMTRLEKLKYI